MPTALELVSAGAGTGKTHDLVTRLVDAVAAGTPMGRIAAITFTNRAADELLRRLKRELVRKGLTQAALESDSAYVSTIHAFCFRLATENPVESGVSPDTRPIDEQETDYLLSRAISESLQEDRAVAEEVRFVKRDCVDFGGDLSADDALRKKVKALIEKARSVAKGPGDVTAMAEENDQDLASLLPSPLPEDRLRREILGPALRRYSDWWEKVGVTTIFPQATEGNHAQIAPLLEPGPLHFETLCDCQPKLWKAKKAAEYDAILGELKDAIIRALFQHPEWNAWYRRYAKALFVIASAAMLKYDSLKQAMGVMDFADMQLAALRMMSKRVAGRPFADYVRSQFDVLVVDEFQDTSPLQFSVAEVLRSDKIRGRYVGDLKQAIYGWRDADPRLFQGLLANAEHPETLRDNRRSRKILVDFFNAIFPPLFQPTGIPYDTVNPKSAFVEKAIPEHGPEITILEGQTYKNQTATRLAAWLANLLKDTTQRVYDRHRDVIRPLRPGDIAVIVRINADVERITGALLKLGIRSSQAARGLGSRPEVQLFRALVAAAAHRDNRLSMASALVSEVYGVPYSDLHRLGELLKSPRGYFVQEVRERLKKDVSSEAWAALERFYSDSEAIAELFRRGAIEDAVLLLIERTRLRDRLAGKADGRQCLANLERCRESVTEFVAAPHNQLAAMGISGRDVEGYLSWFDQIVGSVKELLPQTRPVDEEAVQVMTIHKAKGLEFPITVICTLDDSVLPRLDRCDIVREAGMTTGEILEKARIRLFPGGRRPVPEDLLLRGAEPEAMSDAVRNFYVALTRAQERLVLVWPANPGPDSVLAVLEGVGLLRVGDALSIGGKAFKAHIVSAANEPAPVIPSDLHRRSVLESPDEQAHHFGVVPQRRTGGSFQVTPTQLCAWFDDPSAYPSGESSHGEHLLPKKLTVETEMSVEALKGVIGAAPSLENRTELGRLLHRALAAQQDLATVLDRVEALSGAAARAYASRVLGPFQDHLVALKGNGSFLHEYPLHFRAGSTNVSGILDLGVMSEKGLWIYDLKTHDIEASQVGIYAQYYAPQLWSYALGATCTNLGQIAGLRLFFSTPGLIVTLPSPASDFAERVESAARDIESALRQTILLGQ